MVQNTLAIWVLSLLMLTLGLISHYLIKNRPHKSEGLAFQRYLGIVCGAVGVFGIPVLTFLNPYFNGLGSTTKLIILLLTIVGSLILAEVSWRYLGPPNTPSHYSGEKSNENTP